MAPSIGWIFHEANLKWFQSCFELVRSSIFIKISSQDKPTSVFALIRLKVV